jgi:hypothetical protein
MEAEPSAALNLWFWQKKSKEKDSAIMPITPSRQPQDQPQEQPKKRRTPQRLRRVRVLITVAVATFTLLSGTIAFGQASQDFDLACRSILTAGGGVSTNANYALIGALGVPIVPPKDSDTSPTYAVRSASYGLRAGFLPGYPNGQSAAVVETSQQDAPALDEQTIIQHLPRISKVLFIIRGGC